MKKQYRRTSHTVYEIKYHFIFVPKYRFAVLNGKVKERLQIVINQICESMEILLVEGQICKDHVHMCLSVPPKYAPAEVMKQIKGKTSEVVFREFPDLTKRYWGRHFWARGYFVSTVGIDEETIRRYIKNQKENDTTEKQLTLWK
jgi:putative transposase